MAQVQNRGEVRGDAVGVGVDQHVVVEPEDRVVQRGGVQLDGDPWVAGEGHVVGEQHVADLGRDRVPGVFLLPFERDLRAVRVAEQDPDRGAVVSLLLEQLDVRGVLLGQEEPGVNQDADGANLCVCWSQSWSHGPRKSPFRDRKGLLTW